MSGYVRIGGPSEVLPRARSGILELLRCRRRGSGLSSASTVPPRLGGYMAGESAQREYERRRSARRQHMRKRWPLAVVVVVGAGIAGAFLPAMLTGAAGAPSPGPSLGLGLMLGIVAALRLLIPPQSEVAWRQGAEGERVVEAALDALVAHGAVILHDRRMPKSRANIDHIAVTPAGVFTVDAKRYSGKLEARARGRELWVGGRNRSKLLEQANRQAQAVEQALRAAGVTAPVRPALCFVGTEFPLLFAPTEVGGVVITGPRKLRRHLMPAGADRLSPSAVRKVASVLDDAFPPAGSPAKPTARSAPQPRPQPKVKPPPVALSGRESSADRGPAPCPRCGAEMVRRNRKSDGEPFLGCSTFPKCRGTMQLPTGGDAR